MNRRLMGLASLLGLFWGAGGLSAQSGTPVSKLRLNVARSDQAKWQDIGLTFTSDTETAGMEKVSAPRVRVIRDEAAATGVPWVDSNAWRYQLGLQRAFYSELPERTGALALAEAYSYGVEAAFTPNELDHARVKEMAAFLKTLPPVAGTSKADIGLVKTSSENLEEVANLMTRRNLLYRAVAAPDPKLALNIKLGTPEFPESEAAEPYEFASKVRGLLTDAKRSIRLYNTSVVLVRLVEHAGGARLYLLNYATHPAKDVQVRVLGNYGSADLHAFGTQLQRIRDFTHLQGGTEFVIPEVNTFAVVDLTKSGAHKTSSAAAKRSDGSLSGSAQ